MFSCSPAEEWDPDPAFPGSVVSEYLTLVLNVPADLMLDLNNKHFNLLRCFFFVCFFPTET